MAYNTGNAVPSRDARDLVDNAENLDSAVNGDALSFQDRLGKARKSWAGMEQDFADFLAASGYEPEHLEYQEGVALTVDRPTQLIDYDGSVYRVKFPANFPVELSGAWESDESLLVDVADQALRSQLASTSGAGMVGYRDSTLASWIAAILSGAAIVTDPAYGADNTGATSCVAAVQEAANESRGLFFPKGTYLFDGAVDLGTLDRVAQGIEVKGCGHQTKLIGSSAMAGLPIFRLSGDFNIQQWNNRIEGFVVDLQGAASFVDFNGGCHTSAVRDCFVFDSTFTAGVIGIRIYNSFNITLENVRTLNLNGPAVQFRAISAGPGFNNLTNCKIKDSIFQTNQVANLIDISLEVAADTLTIENTALKATSAGARCFYADGYINQLKLDTLHIESSQVGLASASGKTIDATVSNCLFTDTAAAFSWGASGAIVLQNTRFTNGSGNNVWALLNASVEIVGQYLVSTSSYNGAIQSGTGTIRRPRVSVVDTVGARTLARHEDNFRLMNSGGALDLALPSTADVGAGFRVGGMVRGGALKMIPNAADRILGISGTSAGASISSSATGAYVELTSQNVGGQPFWQITALVGSWATP